MSMKETIGGSRIVISLDKPRIIKMTMRSLLVLEEIYGTVSNAMDAFRNTGDSHQYYVTVVNYLYALTGGITRREIENNLNERNIIDLPGKLMQAVFEGLPENSGSNNENKNECYDWDWLYYLGRYRLLMKEDEIWDCSPKKYFKLLLLWNKDHDISTSSQNEYEVDELPW